MPATAGAGDECTPTASRRRRACARSSSSPTAYDISSGTTRRATRPRKVYGFYSKDSLEYLVSPAHEQEGARQGGPNLAHRRPHVPARGGQAGGRAVREQVPQGAARPGHGDRQDPRRRLALRHAHAGRMGQAHPLPLRPPRAPQAGRPRLQGVPARRAPRRRRQRDVEGSRQAHLPRHLPGDDEVLRDFDVGFFDLDHRRRVAP